MTLQVARTQDISGRTKRGAICFQRLGYGLSMPWCSIGLPALYAGHIMLRFSQTLDACLLAFGGDASSARASAQRGELGCSHQRSSKRRSMAAGFKDLWRHAICECRKKCGHLQCRHRIFPSWIGMGAGTQVVEHHGYRECALQQHHLQYCYELL